MQLNRSIFTSPPPYQEVVDPNARQFTYDGETGASRLSMYEELFKLFESLSLEKKRIAEDAMAVEVAKPQTTDILRAQVRKLAGSAATIDEIFERVRLGLKMLDNKNYRDDNDQPIRKFHPTWVGFQKVTTRTLRIMPRTEWLCLSDGLRFSGILIRRRPPQRSIFKVLTPLPHLAGALILVHRLRQNHHSYRYRYQDRGRPQRRTPRSPIFH